MIVTVTPNPSLDRSVLLDRLDRGEVHRAGGVHVDPGGKGVNVARVLTAADHSAVAVLPTGGVEGNSLAELLAPEAVSVVEVPVEAATRSNLTLVEADGTTTKINEPGNALTTGELEALRTRLGEVATRARWVVASGSLPHGCPDDYYAGLVRTARGAGAKVAVDSSGAALAEACAAGPDLLAPNLAELTELAGHRPADLAEVAATARAVRSEGTGSVLVTLGEHGALLVEDESAWFGTSNARRVRSTVGAGDAALAGYLLAGGDGPEALRSAVAYGSAAVELPGSRMPTPKELRIEQVRITEVDESGRLDPMSP
ncbi:1-phosphofructokinase [Actinopolyspora lacussalsi]|nr:1-phosphofructokinase [Actinopolyspora lacussalsi]